MAMSTAGKPQREMKVLSLGLPRTGSASMAEAFRVLGYEDVYHGLNAVDVPQDWHFFNRATDASFPILPTYRGTPFTREEWDELYGPCEVTTDVASLFAPQLIKTYPDAKVVLVERDYDKWYKSVDASVFEGLWGTLPSISVEYLEPLLGSIAGPTSRKMVQGFFGAMDVESVRRNARATFDRHSRVIREMVPPERLLIYQLGEGWGPLCEFLGKPVPETEFPWVNEGAAMQRLIKEKITKNAIGAAGVVMPYVLGIGALGVGGWMYAGRAS